MFPLLYVRSYTSISPPLFMQSIRALQRTYSIIRNIVPSLSSKKSYLVSPGRFARSWRWWDANKSAVYKTFATMATDPKKYRLNHSMIRVKDPKASGTCHLPKTILLLEYLLHPLHSPECILTGSKLNFTNTSA